MPSGDPNFPKGLDIKPFESDVIHGLVKDKPIEGGEEDFWEQREAISQYGIAGRVWEATEPLIEYLTPSSTIFQPRCPIFESTSPRNILELGSGQGLASLHLANYLTNEDRIILTDLPQVIELCEKSISRWSGGHKAANVKALALAWGEDSAGVLKYGPFTHILMCDLIYFPHLYPLLLRTLLDVTESTLAQNDPDSDTYGPEIIISYKSRTLALEESFFEAFTRYFKLEPVLGGKWEAKLYLAKRWRTTSEWTIPDIEVIMNGAPGVIVGREFALIDELFGSIEYE